MADNENENQQSPLPLNPDLAGYPTPEALVQGYRNSSAEAQRLRQEVEKRDALLMQVLQNNQSPNDSRRVPDRSGRPEDRLTEFGVPVDALNELVNARVESALAPIVRGVSARGKMVTEHPDYIQFEQDVANFISSDPDLSKRYPRMFEADPEAAMEYAFLKFGDSRRRTGSEPQQANRNGIADAAIPGGRSGDSRRQPTDGDAVREAYERWRKTGSSTDAAAFAKARLRGVITDDFLNA